MTCSSVGTLILAVRKQGRQITARDRSGPATRNMQKALLRARLLPPERLRAAEDGFD
jgi:hypothetical protein